MPFLNLNKQFPSPATFAAWLNDQPPPTWGVVGSTYHNTYIPTELQWRGAVSMESMQTTYEAKNPPWDRGPHVYLVVGSPNRFNDGIWVMCPPTEEGIHAGDCNDHRFGLEAVGNFQSRPMSLQLIDLLVDAAAALHRWAGLGPNINAHRDCMPGRTCPGDAAYNQKPIIQQRLATALDTYTEFSRICSEPPPITPRDVAVQITPANGYTAYDIQSIVEDYWNICLPVEVNPLLAVAQMCHETGNLTSFWSSRPQRNPAGIGVTGRWSKTPKPGYVYNTERGRWEMGISFTSWQHQSIPAHVGRLVAYATNPEERTSEQQRLVEFALGFRDLPDELHGSAPILRQLGAAHNPTGQGWAKPGTRYGAKIAAKANALLGA